MTKIVKVTRGTKNVGYGYSSACIQGLYGLEIEPVTHPTYFGTIKHVMGAIDTDKYLESLKSNREDYKESWFVKVNNEWRKIKRGVYSPANLLDLCPTFTQFGNWTNDYQHDYLEFEVE